MGRERKGWLGWNLLRDLHRHPGRLGAFGEDCYLSMCTAREPKGLITQEVMPDDAAISEKWFLQSMKTVELQLSGDL